MALQFYTFNWTAFNTALTLEPERLAEEIAARVGQSTLAPEALLSESLQEPYAQNIESLLRRDHWYSAETANDAAAADAITVTLLTDPVGDQFELTPLDAALDFATLALTAVTAAPSRQVNPATGDVVEIPARPSFAHKQGLNLKSFPQVLGRRYRSTDSAPQPGPELMFGIHGPDDIATMLAECRTLVEALVESNERRAKPMASELTEDFLTPVSAVASDTTGLFAWADT